MNIFSKMQQQEILSEQPLNQAPSDAVSVNELSISVGNILVAYLSFIFTVLVLIILHTNLRKAVLNRFLTIKHSQKIPCSKCRYFKNSRYLQCAVNPTKVLSKDAINCSDYLPKNNKFIH